MKGTVATAPRAPSGRIKATARWFLNPALPPPPSLPPSIEGDRGHRPACVFCRIEARLPGPDGEPPRDLLYEDDLVRVERKGGRTAAPSMRPSPPRYDYRRDDTPYRRVAPHMWW